MPSWLWTLKRTRPRLRHAPAPRGGAVRHSSIAPNGRKLLFVVPPPLAAGRAPAGAAKRSRSTRDRPARHARAQRPSREAGRDRAARRDPWDKLSPCEPVGQVAEAERDARLGRLGGPPGEWLAAGSAAGEARPRRRCWSAMAAARRPNAPALSRSAAPLKRRHGRRGGRQRGQARRIAPGREGVPVGSVEPHRPRRRGRPKPRRSRLPLFGEQ
jgi:hypothetical protein